MTRRVLVGIVGLVERVVGRRRLAKFARLLTMQVRLDVPNDMAANGEALIQQWALTLPGPSVVLDVGAHFGEWSVSLLSAASRPVVLHAFEPSSYSIQRARREIGRRGEVHPVALSDEVGAGELHIVHEGAGSNSVLRSADGTRPVERVETIAFDTVDHFTATQGITHVTLLKIDAEGHDLAVLRGAAGLLGAGLVDLVQFEYNHRWIDSRAFLLDAFLLLEGHGYRVGKVTPRGVETYDRWHPELEKFVEANYLAYRPQLVGQLTTLAWWGP